MHVALFEDFEKKKRPLRGKASRHRSSQGLIARASTRSPVHHPYSFVVAIVVVRLTMTHSLSASDMRPLYYFITLITDVDFTRSNSFASARRPVVGRRRRNHRPQSERWPTRRDRCR